MKLRRVYISLCFFGAFIIVFPGFSCSQSQPTSTTAETTNTPMSKSPADIAQTYADTFYNPAYWAALQSAALSKFSDDFIRGLVDPLSALAKAKGINTYSEAASLLKQVLTLDTTLTAANYNNLLFIVPLNYGVTDVGYPKAAFENIALMLRRNQNPTALQVAEIKLKLDALKDAVSKAKTSDILLVTEAKLSSLKSSVIKGIDSSELFLDGLVSKATTPTPTVVQSPTPATTPVAPVSPSTAPVSLVWDTPINISQSPSMWSGSPHILAEEHQNDIYVLWTEGNVDQTKYLYGRTGEATDSAGRTWRNPFNISSAMPGGWGPVTALASADLGAVALFGGGGGTVWVYDTLNWDSWKTETWRGTPVKSPRNGTYIGPIGMGPFTYTAGYPLTVLIKTKEGKLALVVGIALALNDYGLGWLDEPVAWLSGAKLPDPKIVGVDQAGNSATIHLVWDDDGEIYYKRALRKKDSVPTWEETKRLSGGNRQSSSPALCAARDKSLHVVWSEGNGDSSRLLYSQSPDGTKWTTPIYLSNDSGENPALASDKNGGIHLAYSSKGDIMYMTKQAGGAWSSPLNVSTNPSRSVLPYIAVGRSSQTVFIAWQDFISDQPEILFKAGRPSQK